MSFLLKKILDSYQEAQKIYYLANQLQKWNGAQIKENPINQRIY